MSLVLSIPSIDYFPSKFEIKAVGEYFIEADSSLEIRSLMSKLRYYSQGHQKFILNSRDWNFKTQPSYNPENFSFNFEVRYLNGRLKDQILLEQTDRLTRSFKLTLDFSQKIKNENDFKNFEGRFIAAGLFLVDEDLRKVKEYRTFLEVAKLNFERHLIEEKHLTQIREQLEKDCLNKKLEERLQELGIN